MYSLTVAISFISQQAVFNVTKARYPMSKEELHTLAGFQAAISQAEKEEKDIKASSSSVKSELHRFYPPYLLSEVADTKPKSLADCSNKDQSKASIPHYKRSLKNR